MALFVAAPLPVGVSVRARVTADDELAVRVAVDVFVPVRVAVLVRVTVAVGVPVTRAVLDPVDVRAAVAVPDTDRVPAAVLAADGEMLLDTLAVRVLVRVCVASKARAENDAVGRDVPVRVPLVLVVAVAVRVRVPVRGAVRVVDPVRDNVGVEVSDGTCAVRDVDGVDVRAAVLDCECVGAADCRAVCVGDTEAACEEKEDGGMTNEHKASERMPLVTNLCVCQFARLCWLALAWRTENAWPLRLHPTCLHAREHVTWCTSTGA